MAQFEDSFVLQVPSATENLAMIRAFVERVGEKAGMDEKEIARITLAVDEACANVIEHAYGQGKKGEVTITAVFDEQVLDFTIGDSGKGFDPAAIKEAEVDELIRARKSGGLGLRLIRTIMDDVQYRITPGHKNELRMTKKLKK
jgi:anti-sigma regulatory factor (Ser/Thr protein kinase)